MENLHLNLGDTQRQQYMHHYPIHCYPKPNPKVGGNIPISAAHGEQGNMNRGHYHGHGYGLGLGLGLGLGHGHLDNGDSEPRVAGVAAGASKTHLTAQGQAAAASSPYYINYGGGKPAGAIYQCAPNTLNAAASAYNVRSLPYHYSSLGTSNVHHFGASTQHLSSGSGSSFSGGGGGGASVGGGHGGTTAGGAGGGGAGLLPKPTYSAPAQFSTHLLPTPEPSHFPLNVSAASFSPGQGLLSMPMSSLSQPLLQTPQQALAQAQAQRYMTKSQHSGWRRQPMPDLFHAVLALMRELDRSVSYPEIIYTLSLRLQRPEVELKRHVPHTLHAAVNNGYLRKDGNRYTLLSEPEQLEIMRRNQEAAKRAKELEKEPLSWRKR